MRAKITGGQMRMIDIRHLWLVFIAYIPQFFAFYFTPTQKLIPDRWIPLLLIGSQVFLLIFALINRKVEGFRLLGFGLLCNSTVIALNSGFMPITPDNAQKLIPPGSNLILELGERVGLGKDILLLKEETVLWFLGDVFTLPPGCATHLHSALVIYLSVWGLAGCFGSLVALKKTLWRYRHDTNTHI